MCFSATASFIAGSALSAGGIVTLRMTARRAEIPFAMIPLLFGVQQLIEGMVWLSLANGPPWPNTATLLYLVGAVGGCLLSSSKIIQAFGALLLVTFVAAYAIHAATLISMWCFFAAIMSSIVYLYFRNAQATVRPALNVVAR